MLGTRESIIAVCYIVASVLLILGLKRLSSPATARSGNSLAAIGVFLALAATLLDREIVSYWEIGVGVAIGAALGIYAARRVQMTAMPQMVGLLNGLGGGTAALVSLSEFLRLAREGPVGASEATSVVLGTAIGAVSFTGSIIAFAKLQELLSGRPLQFPLQRALNALLFLAILALGALLVVGGGNPHFLWGIFGVALALGALLVLPIGGGDMPVVISTLNALTGMAAAFTGVVLHNQMLVVAGVLVGASGTLLTILMGRAMNRSLGNVLFGAFGAESAAGPSASAGGPPRTIRQTTAEDTAIALAYARNVVIVPGYGLAVAEGQHAVRELSQELEKRGVNVKYAIHPVAGRMPGHLNVILSDAQVEYDALVGDIDEGNALLQSADVALVVGANDTVNPAALEDRTSPIYGMPIFDVRKAKSTIVLKRSLGVGFAGIDNPLFYQPNTAMLLGDAKQTLKSLSAELKSMNGAGHG
ncbi:MAG: NAD(P)(+) transhydrogenase (Re/Si-specific) subunit beta [Gemmatimonadaceae bacterium]|nr:NAD(P)(+) transhydrogenase (Re/Si-specific) subunit beta [Gemmatimonadaceae bacterium]